MINATIEEKGEAQNIFKLNALKKNVNALNLLQDLKCAT